MKRMMFKHCLSLSMYINRNYSQFRSIMGDSIRESASLKRKDFSKTYTKSEKFKLL